MVFPLLGRGVARDSDPARGFAGARQADGASAEATASMRVSDDLKSGEDREAIDEEGFDRPTETIRAGTEPAKRGADLRAGRITGARPGVTREQEG